MIKNDEDLEKAKKKILKIKQDIKEFENSKTSKTFTLRVSITGITRRVYNKQLGFTIAQIRKHYKFPLEEFCENFKIAREANQRGDIETVDKFFEIYI